MKSPIAPPRIVRIRFNSRLILRKGAGENRQPVYSGDTVNRVPARVTVRAPIDLVAQQVRYRHPKEARDDEQIGEHGHKQAARFVTEECRLQERLVCEEAQNTAGAARLRASKEYRARELRGILPRIAARGHNRSGARSLADGESWRTRPSPSWPEARTTRPKPDSTAQCRRCPSAG